MSDLISRQAAIKILHEALDAADQIADVPFGVYQNYRDKMNELPPAQPKRINGRWIPVGGALYQCDQCGAVSLERKFCSECGADMREATE